MQEASIRYLLFYLIELELIESVFKVLVFTSVLDTGFNTGILIIVSHHLHIFLL
jgi:ribosomal protein L11 methylase PrmA